MPRDTASILDGVPGQAEFGLRIEVLDPDLNLVGNVSARIDPKGGEANAGKIDWNPSNKIARSWSGVEFDPEDAAQLEPAVNRLRPQWTVPLTGAEYPLGTFHYLGGVEPERAGGDWVKCRTMPDLSHALAQKIGEPFDIAAGQPWTDALAAIAAQARVAATDIVPSTSRNGTVPLAWAVGKTTWLDICARATNALGYLPVYFDAAGSMRARPVPTPDEETPAHFYDDGSVSRVILDTVDNAMSVADQPNVYIVRSTAPAQVPVSARYSVPADAPNSVQTIGYEIVVVYDVDGIASAAQAFAAAQALAVRDRSATRTTDFDATPDPRHDGWDVVQWRGERMLEQAWSLTLAPGGPHHHVLKRTYAP